MERSRQSFFRDDSGYVVVEATFLYPLVFLVFFCVMLLAFYLPTRAALQSATQNAATSLAVERSDTWITWNEELGLLTLEEDGDQLHHVYYSVFEDWDQEAKACALVQNYDYRLLPYGAEDIEVSYDYYNYITYSEIRITATIYIEIPLDLSMVGLTSFPMSVQSIATVQDGDGFITQVDMASTMSEELFSVLTNSENGLSNFIATFDN